MNINPLLAMQRPEWFDAGIEQAAMAIEFAGVVIILIGALISMCRYGLELLRGTGNENKPYRNLRLRLGRAILLGLEFLVAADIIATVMIDPTLRSVSALGLVVLIRTFLSWSLEVELEGRWPWQGQSV